LRHSSFLFHIYPEMCSLANEMDPFENT